MSSTIPAARDNPTAGTPLDRPEDVGFSRDRLALLDAAMLAALGDGGYPGVTVMVARHGQLVHAKDYGVQDIETGAPLRSNSIFRMASMTKPFTGMALLALYEDGAWQLDDPVERFLPELADIPVLADDGTLVPQHRPMTMRELLTSTGGIAGTKSTVSDHLANGPGQEVKRRYRAAVLYAGTSADLVTKISMLPLAFQPGTKFQYGTSHDVQGRMVEVLSGQPLDEFLRARLCEPLGLVDTDFSIPESERHRLMPLAAYDDQLRLVPATYRSEHLGDSDWGERPRFLAGASGLYSTAADYLRFTLMLLNHGELDGTRVLSPPSIELLARDQLGDGITVQSAVPLLYQGWGIGFCLVRDPGRATMAGGPVGPGTYYWAGAHGSWFWIDPMNDLVVVGMTQLQGSGAVQMGHRLPAPDLRARSRSLVYQALTHPER